jgi:hypothetical protein
MIHQRMGQDVGPRKQPLACLAAIESSLPVRTRRLRVGALPDLLLDPPLSSPLCLPRIPSHYFPKGGQRPTWSGVLFCISSAITKTSLKVRPRMKPSGNTCRPGTLAEFSGRGGRASALQPGDECAERGRSGGEEASEPEMRAAALSRCCGAGKSSVYLRALGLHAAANLIWIMKITCAIKSWSWSSAAAIVDMGDAFGYLGFY